MLHLIIPLAAKPQGSKRGFVQKGRVVMVEASTDLKKVRNEFTRLIKIQADGWIAPHPDAAITVSVWFQFEKPKTAKRRYMTTVPDNDKLVRFTLDSLTDAGVWFDDKQVTEIHAYKRYGDTNLTEIMINYVN